MPKPEVKKDGHKPFTDDHEPVGISEGQAKIDIARILTEVPDDKLSQRTRTDLSMLNTLVLQEVFDALANPEETRDATELYRLFRDRRALSLKGQLRHELIKIAETKKEDEKAIGDMLGV